MAEHSRRPRRPVPRPQQTKPTPIATHSLTNIPMMESVPAISPDGYIDTAMKAVQYEGIVDENGLIDTQVDRTPVMEGFEDPRYQEHDAMIERLVDAFNADKAAGIHGTKDQAAQVPDLDPALVKSWAIQESGGSPKAWAVDPMQVNNPGDWDPAKQDLGLTKSRRRNSGDLETNMRAAIQWMARKGFSRSAKPTQDLTGGQEFKGYQTALENYNGRGKTMQSGPYKGQKYREAYADRIIKRAEDPETRQRIPLGRKP